MEVEVAAVQINREPLFEGPGRVMKALDRGLAWGDRPMVVVDVGPETKLPDVLDAGARRLKLRAGRRKGWRSATRPSEAAHGFYFDGDGEAGQITEFDTTLNKDGSAQWWFDPSSLTVGDVLTAKDAGLFYGNPQRLYIVVDEPPDGVGNGIDFWFEVMRALPQIQGWAKNVADVAEPWATLINVTAAASIALQKVRTRWDGTGGDLKRFGQLFRLARNTEQAATLLRIREEYVPAILHFLGLEQGADGYWRPSNKPERKQLAELAAVANSAGHMSLRAEALRKGLADVLALPPGQRAKQADGIFRKHQFEAYEYGQHTKEPYVARAENGRDDQFEVLDFDAQSNRIVLGTIQVEADGTFSVIDPDGRTVVNRDGSDMRFSDIDQAAGFIGAGYTRR